MTEVNATVTRALYHMPMENVTMAEVSKAWTEFCAGGRLSPVSSLLIARALYHMPRGTMGVSGWDIAVAQKELANRRTL